VISRESLLTHFILLHLLSTGYLPSITPSALIQHARTITSALRRKLSGGGDHTDITDIESSTPPLAGGYKGKEKEGNEENVSGWYGMGTEREDRQDDNGWWKAWDVSADCREIGGMECYGKSTAQLRAPFRR
jgi:hypothetical protein